MGCHSRLLLRVSPYVTLDDTVRAAESQDTRNESKSSSTPSTIEFIVCDYFLNSGGGRGVSCNIYVKDLSRQGFIAGKKILTMF